MNHTWQNANGRPSNFDLISRPNITSHAKDKIHQ